MQSPYAAYYAAQSGNGIAVFKGIRVQRGHGFFSRLFSSAVLPALKFLGKKAAVGAANVVADTVLDGKKFKQSAKDRSREVLKEAATAGVNKVRAMTQRGGKRLKANKRRPVKRRKTQVGGKRRKVIRKKTKSKHLHFLK